jgi:transposase-like protein
MAMVYSSVADSMAEIAKHFGRNSMTVNRAVRKHEEKRKDGVE